MYRSHETDSLKTTRPFVDQTTDSGQVTF